MTQRNFSFVVNADPGISFETAAKELGVSIASIQNWIKTGYLISKTPRTISKSSWDVFVEDVAGSEKLTMRANKLRRDNHDHAAVEKTVLAGLEQGGVGEDFSAIYEESLSNAYRNQEGIYYTPIEIANQFFNVLPKDKTNLVFCDPCCGSGNFLLAAVNAGFLPKNVYGLDVDTVALQIARVRLSEAIGGCPTRFNISCQDFLASNATPIYDVIFTNPPWGKKLPKTVKDDLSDRLGTGKSNDTSSLFVAAALDRLKMGGFLGMLLPDSFFNVATFEEIRRVVLSNRVLEFSDHDRPFAGLISKAKSLVLKKETTRPQALIRCRSENGTHRRTHKSFSAMPKKRFNFSTTENEIELIKHLYDQPYLTLKNNAKWGMGIVTGNNKKHLKSANGKGLIPVWKGADIQPDSLAPPTNFISDNFGQYQQVAKPELFRVDQKLIYKFISSRLVFFCDTEQRFVINSANFVIPHDNFPVPGAMLAKFLTSDLVNWLFRVLFETHKVLRTDLEFLPVFHEFLSLSDLFVESDLLDYLKIESFDGTYRIKD